MNTSLLNEIKKYIDVLEKENVDSNIFTRKKIQRLKRIAEKLTNYFESGNAFDIYCDILEIA